MVTALQAAPAAARPVTRLRPRRPVLQAQIEPAPVVEDLRQPRPPVRVTRGPGCLPVIRSARKARIRSCEGFGSTQADRLPDDTQGAEAWISRPGSGAISVNRQVPLSDYPDPVSRALAEELTRATDVHFDASDSMPQMMQNAFLGAVLEYLDAPSQLNVILRGLDQVRKAAY